MEGIHILLFVVFVVYFVLVRHVLCRELTRSCMIPVNPSRAQHTHTHTHNTHTHTHTHTAHRTTPHHTTHTRACPHEVSTPKRATEDRNAYILNLLVFKDKLKIFNLNQNLKCLMFLWISYCREVILIRLAIYIFIIVPFLHRFGNFKLAETHRFSLRFSSCVVRLEHVGCVGARG